MILHTLGVQAETFSLTGPKAQPRGSKYPIFQGSGPKSHYIRLWFLGSESFNIGYVDPLGNGRIPLGI